MILYKRQLVLGHLCKSLIPAHPWKLLVPGVLGHPWKGLPCLYHRHPRKWVQGIIPGAVLEMEQSAWVEVVLLW